VGSIVELSGGKLIAIDGKSLRRSFEKGWDKSGMAHMVSAFVQANHMVFAQVKADGKGQELAAIARLLGILDLEGAVVSIDALGCQKEIARQIAQGKGHYVLEAKNNQPTLHDKLKATLDDCLLDNFAGMEFDQFAETESGHGRLETRKLWVCWDVQLLGDLLKDWPDVKGIIMVERTRQTFGQTKVSVKRHYYISSLDRRTKAKRLAGCIRGHWSVENNLHWQLDVSFREDERRNHKGHGAENFSRLCRMALNMLKNETTLKVGIANKRKTCGWDNDYVLKVALT
jgi:predicted transposase YbfD/YdcC